jgi:queuosine precursor transporter
MNHQLICKDKQSDSYRLLLPIAMAYGVLLVLSNALASKITLIAGMPVAAGILCFPLTYIINDVLTEVYGFKVTRRIIWYGFILLFFSVSMYQIAIVMPSAGFWINKQVVIEGMSQNVNMNAAFNSIFGTSSRIATASLLAYLVGSFLNSIVMSYFKILTNGKKLWLRTISSTIVGEGADSIIFAIIAFYGIFGISEILNLAWTGLVLKTLYEVIATPLTYFVISKIKQLEGVDVYDNSVTYNPIGRD